MNEPSTNLSRRQFVSQAVGAAAAVAAAAAFPAATLAAPSRYPIIAFSKPFRKLGPEETADLVADVGWDGIECPVRSKDGHITPERVEEDLPKMVEALQKRGKAVTMITTEITKLDAAGEKVLRTAAKLGIKKYRLGFARYTKDKPVPQTVAEQGAALKDIAAFNGQLGLQAGWQNHSGADYVGAPVWDIWTMIKDLPTEQIGVCFDIGHATLEGGLSWPIQARLMEPRYAVVYVKDFRWEKTDKGWKDRWCRLGEGMVHRSFFDTLKKSSYAGPISQHHEYPDLGTGAAMVADFKKDLATLKEWLGAS
jgi:sugar phosphate isomerase/epimerase